MPLWLDLLWLDLAFKQKLAVWLFFSSSFFGQWHEWLRWMFGRGEAR